MNKNKPSIKELIPTLSAKERVKLLLRDILSQTKMLTAEEKKALIMFSTQDELNEGRYHLQLAISQILLAYAFFDAFHELQYKAEMVFGLYSQIATTRAVEVVVRFLESIPKHDDTNGKYIFFEIERRLLLEVLREVMVFSVKTDPAKQTEVVSMKPEMQRSFEGAVEMLHKNTVRFVSMREALRRIDTKLENLPSSSPLGKERLDACLKEVRVIQKRHNGLVFRLLKPSPTGKKLGFGREVEDFDAYLLKMPKYTENLVQDYLNMVQSNAVAENTKK